MMSQVQIRAFSREAAAKARREKQLPFTVEQEDIEDWKAAMTGGVLPRLPFPNLGDYTPKGWIPTEEEFFVDASGFGRPDEPALTAEQFINKLEAGKSYAITEVGEFQLYVTVFEKIDQRHSPKVQA